MNAERDNLILERWIQAEMRADRLQQQLDIMNDHTRDPIARPSHYAGTYGLEAIDAIRNMLSPEEFRGFLRGNQLKYLWRYNRKNGIEDLQKAQQLGVWLLEDVKHAQQPGETSGRDDGNNYNLRPHQTDRDDAGTADYPVS